MKGKYTTQAGESVEVLNFDADNKIAYADFKNGECKWVGENEYSLWVSEEQKVSEHPEVKEDPTVIEEPIVAEPVYEEPPVVIEEKKAEVVGKPKPAIKPNPVKPKPIIKKDKK